MHQRYKVTQPQFLKPGDTIGIVAPARKVAAKELADGIKILEGWGFNVRLGENIFKEQNQYSGTDAERAKDLQTMLDDKSVKAIISARGGYGTVRIIDKLDFSKFKQYPKWLVGYSDMTVIHNHLQNHFQTQSIHGCMLFNMQHEKFDKDAVESLGKAFTGVTLHYKFSASNNQSLNKNGNAKGILCGGNLSLLYALSGSVSDIDTKGKVLFIEDLDEYLYHIDRMMMQLKRSGKLQNLAGLIVGGMSDMRDNTIPFGKTAEEIIREHVDEYNYPVCFDFPAGHVKRNLALIMGANVELSVSETVDLKFLK